MKFSVDLYKQKPELIIEHRGEELRFLANVFGRKAFQNTAYDVFDHINRYWDGLPGYTQDAIFSVYKDVSAAFDMVTNMDEVFTILNRSIAKLIEYHPLEQLEFWLSTDPTIFVPDTVKDAPPDPNENMFTNEKTYTRRDYFPLIALSMFLRTIVPIWGQYIESIRQNSEMNRKEFIALQLLRGTGLLECKAMNRLRVYINETAAVNDVDYAKILSGFSSEDIGFLFLALVCVRRLCLGDLRGVDPKTQIIATVFKFLAQKTFNQTESEITIKKEDLRGEGGADTGKHSILESYRKRTELSLGEIAEMEYALEDLIGIAQRLEPTITEQEVMSSVATAAALENERITNVQLVMAGWLIKDQITPHALYYVSKRHNARLLGALEAVLWKRGYKYLASIITSHAIIGQEEIIVGNISSREQIDPRLVLELKKYYPFEWSTVRKNVETPQPHGVVHSIDHIVDELTFHAYRSTMAESKLKEIYNEIRRKVSVFSDIKNILAELVIDIERRKTIQQV